MSPFGKAVPCTAVPFLPAFQLPWNWQLKRQNRSLAEVLAHAPVRARVTPVIPNEVLLRPFGHR